MQRSDAVIAIVSMFIIAMMILTPTGLAVSVSYTASTTSASNSISASYFTVGAYSKNNFDPSSLVDNSGNPVVISNVTYNDNEFTPMSSPFLSNVNVLYNKSGNNYTINSTYMLTYNNCYLCIRHSSGSAENYTVSFADTIPSEIETAYGNSISIQYSLNNYNYKSISETSTMMSEQVYKFSIRLVFSYNKTTEPPNLSIDYTTSSIKITSGTMTGAQTVTLTEAASNTEIDSIINVNPGSNGNTISTGGVIYNLTVPEDNYGNDSAVRISNSGNSNGGIGSPDGGKIFLNFYLPSKSFYIAIKSEAPVTQQMNLEIATDYEGEIFDDLVRLPNGASRYIIWDYDSAAISNNPPDRYHYIGNAGRVTIAIDAGSNDNIQPTTTFDIVFKK